MFVVRTVISQSHATGTPGRWYFKRSSSMAVLLRWDLCTPTAGAYLARSLKERGGEPLGGGRMLPVRCGRGSLGSGLLRVSDEWES
jgi:hypothetical protein